MQKNLYLPLLVLITGCASQPEPIATGMDPDANVFVIRPTASRLYILRAAPILLDGQKVGTVGYGERLALKVGAGRHVLASKTFDTPGACELNIKVLPGHRYYFRVDPRQESFGAFLAGDLAAFMITHDMWVSLAGGMALASLESYGAECGGLFRLYPIQPGSGDEHDAGQHQGGQ